MKTLVMKKCLGEILSSFFLFIEASVCVSIISAQERLIRPAGFFPGEKPLNDIAFSSNGRLFASASIHDTSIMLYDVKSLPPVEEISEAGNSGFIYWLRKLNGYKGQSFAFSPDGKLIASGGDKTINVWDVQSGQLIMHKEAHQGLGAIHVAFRPDGKLLASTGWDNWIQLWDTRTWNKLGTLPGHYPGGGMGLNQIAFSPDGAALAIYAQQTIKLIDLMTGQELHVLTDSTHAVRKVLFNSDGSLIISAGFTIKIWNTQTGQLVKTLDGHPNGVFYIAFRYDDKILASIGKENIIKFWDMQSGQILYSHHVTRDGACRNLAFSPNGLLLANSRNGGYWGGVDLWDISRIIPSAKNPSK